MWLQTPPKTHASSGPYLLVILGGELCNPTWEVRERRLYLQRPCIQTAIVAMQEHFQVHSPITFS